MTISKFQRAKALLVQGVYGLVGLGDTSIDMSDAPGGDLNLDDIFGDPSSPTTGATEPSTPSEPVATTTPDGPVIKTKTGTVYKTLDDAVSGIEHKDALIAELRTQVQKATGADPLRQRRDEPRPVDYTQEKEKYFEDIASAVERKDPAAYMEAQKKLIFDSLGPLGPTLVGLARANAERVVSEQYPEFKGFLSSEDYRNLEADSPLLADAIRQAEGNPAAGAQLPELYRVAYLTTQGRKVPELLQSVKTQSAPVQSRPTIHSSPAAPPPSTSGRVTAQPNLDTREGRKAIIEQQERSGVMDLKW